MINDIKNKLKNEYLIKLNKKKQMANQLSTQIINNHPELKKIEEEISGVACNQILAMIEYETANNKNHFENLINDLTIKKLQYLKDNHIDFDYDKPKYECQICDDSGYDDKDFCICFKQKLSKYVFKKNYTLDIENIDLDSYSFEIFKNKEHKNKMINHLSYIREYFKYINENKYKNLIIFGENGLGKTYMLSALCNSLIKAGKIVVYQSAPVLIERLKAEAFSNEETNIEEILKECDLLIIDDLGKEYISDYSISHLFNIINERYNNKKSIAISTNIHINNLHKEYGEAIQSRLIENGTLLEFNGENLRLKR